MQPIRYVIILVCAFLQLSAHSQSFEWLKSGGGPLSDKATDIAVDADGNVFITGYYNEQAVFGPHVIPFSNPSSKEVFVAKLDPNGNYLWVKTGENYFDDRGLGLCIDKQGNVIVTGTAWGGMNFGSLSVYNSTSYTDQIFVLKLDGNGNELWMKNAGVDSGGYPYNDDHGFNLDTDSLGNIYVTGFISNNSNSPQNATFDAFTINLASNDSLAYIGKLNSSGAWQWVKTFDGESGSRDNDIVVDNENNAYVVGGFSGIRVFGDTTLSSAGGTDMYLVKYDENGNFQFAKRAGGPLDDRANAICFDHASHLYITGEFRDKAGFDLDSVNNNGGPNGRDIFVTRMSKKGDFEWVKKAGSNGGSDRGNGIITNQEGNIFVTGEFKGLALFGGNLELNSNLDSTQFFVAAIDSFGKWRWAMQGGGTDEDRGNKIAVDEDCNIYSCGFYELTMFTAPHSITAAGKKDVFVSKIADGCFGYSNAPPPPIDPNNNPMAYCVMNTANLFTPNNDGINDYIQFSDSCNLEVDIRIMNRWGIQVYTSKDPTNKWFGKDQKGNTLSEGVYFYMIQGKFPNGIEINEHGYLTLLGN